MEKTYEIFTIIFNFFSGNIPMGKLRILIYTGALVAIIVIRILNSGSRAPEDLQVITVNEAPFRQNAIEADFTFSIDIQGKYFADNKPVSIEEILAIIDNSGKDKSTVSVQLLIAKKTQFTHVQKLTDILKKNGVLRVSYAFNEQQKN